MPHAAPADKPARDRLPNRRAAISTSFERDGARFEMTAGYYPDGRAGEIFLNADRANSLLDFLMSDAAIWRVWPCNTAAPSTNLGMLLSATAAG